MEMHLCRFQEIIIPGFAVENINCTKNDLDFHWMDKLFTRYFLLGLGNGNIMSINYKCSH